jgi:KaiC/GvpD/RAD55 family RecA-like ATPase
MGYNVVKVPTGVPDFDAIIKGGLPQGSVVLLTGDIGAGQQEFIYTSAYKLAIVKEKPFLMESYIGSFCDLNAIPEHICYVSFSRSRLDILREIAEGFDPEFLKILSRKIHFKDLSAHYYKKSLVPSTWTGDGGNGGELFGGTPKESVLEALIKYLDEVPANSMIIIDSLTDLVVSEEITTPQLVNIMRGLQRASKSWGGIIYLMLTQGVMGSMDQQMLYDSVDGVLVFEWTKYNRCSKRQRYMYVEKFMSVLPHLDMARIARFPTMVTAQSGMTVVNMETIS